MSTKLVNIQIFGRTLHINCPYDQEKLLNQLAKELEFRLKTLKIKTNVNNIEQLLFISALNIFYELKQEQLKIKNYKNKIENCINMLNISIKPIILKKKHIK